MKMVMNSSKSSSMPPMQYHKVSSQDAIPSQLPSSYTLRRYLWRSFLSILGPLLLLGFYSFVCFHYLNRPVDNDIVLDAYPSALLPFYIWVVVSVFALDWARTLLANFQAAALMRPSLRSSNAMVFFWHSDDNWANPLWWLRALRNFVFSMFQIRRKATRYSKQINRYSSLPGLLWTLLSSTTLLVFVAIPLSGLTMEQTIVFTPGEQRAAILGPKSTTFNIKGDNDLPSLIYGVWRSGGNATPPDASYFYAPTGYANASPQYFEDQSRLSPDTEFGAFLGPAVDDIVSGRSFGLKSMVKCLPVPAESLKLIGVHDWQDYDIWDINGPSQDMVWFNETGAFWQKNLYSMIVAADGNWVGDSFYSKQGANDYDLYSVFMNMTQPKEMPQALFEIYLWQGVATGTNDPVMEQLIQDESPLLRKTTRTIKLSNGQYNDTQLVGFGVQCSIRSATGMASVYPNTRTYSNFEYRNVTPKGGDSDVYGPQILAAMALGQWQGYPSGGGGYHFLPRNPELSQSNWLAFHLAIGEPAHEDCAECGGAYGYGPSSRFSYYALTPQDLTFAIYRLLGQTMIAMMGSGSQGPWYDDLYLLKPVRWLVPGPVAWKPVLILLAIWTVITVSVSIWTLFTKRWAPVLSSFDHFRFGAQYAEEVNRFSSGSFDECHELYDIPGMVGMLPGDVSGGQFGFIGLSENVADRDIRYVYDRTKASKARVA